MSGVVLSIVLSGMVSLFISHKFLRERMGLGLAIMFLTPTLSCATYIFLTAPYFNPPPATVIAQSDEPARLSMDKMKEPERPATPEDIDVLVKVVDENPDDIDAVLGLAGALMGREDYDAAISLLKSKETRFPGKELKTQHAIAHFAKGLLFAEQGKYESALDALRIAKETSPEQAPFENDLKYFINIIEEQIAEQASKTQAQE